MSRAWTEEELMRDWDIRLASDPINEGCLTCQHNPSGDVHGTVIGDYLVKCAVWGDIFVGVKCGDYRG